MIVSGTRKPPAGPRVVVAMSGGVDSSVTAALLAEQGYDVVGITLQLYDHGLALARKGACCAGKDLFDARTVADHLGIPHYVLDYEQRFRESVIDDFADSYLRGETPIPCIRCNQRIKFGDLLQTARELGASLLATGHYVRRVEGADGPALLCGQDRGRDQSYFLFATTRAQLEVLRFPLGEMNKDQTRALAQRYGLPVAAKPDSQDICFVPNGSYAETVERLRPGAVQPGEIVDVDGRVLGQHPGVIHFTIGQRRGLGLAGVRGVDPGQPLFVVRLDAARRQVVVGPKAALACPRVRLNQINWLGPELPAPGQGLALAVKLRSTQPPAPATVWFDDAGGALVTLEAPAGAVAPGQACVFYQGERLMGGGWIVAGDGVPGGALGGAAGHPA